MALIKVNKSFIQEKNINVLLGDCLFWIRELLFLEEEITFLKIIVKTYPFKGNTPNLFENIQLFAKDFDAILDQKNQIQENLKTHQDFLKESKTNRSTDTIKLLIALHEDIEKQLLDFFTSYKETKAKLYEFMSELIKQ